MNDRMRVKVRETVDKYQYRYQVRNVTKRIIPDNYPELFEKFGFNIVSIIHCLEIETETCKRIGSLLLKVLKVVLNLFNLCSVDLLGFLEPYQFLYRQLGYVYEASRNASYKLNTYIFFFF